jgi:hypothetical protein
MLFIFPNCLLLLAEEELMAIENPVMGIENPVFDPTSPIVPSSPIIPEIKPGIVAINSLTVTDINGQPYIGTGGYWNLNSNTVYCMSNIGIGI